MSGAENTAVLVPHYVAYGRHLLPRNTRVPDFQLVRQPATGFGDDLDPTFDKPLLFPVALELLKWDVPSLITDTLDRLYHVRQIRSDR